MPAYNVDGFIWSGLGTPTTLVPVQITDDDPNLSSYFANDLNETITIGGATYTNARGGTYQLTFTDSSGASHTEDLLLFSTGSNFIFIPLPGSNFDTGSVVTGLGGWQNWTTGFAWTDVVCFTKGTEIATPTGARLIETLNIGDLVITHDNGLKPIKWIGKKKITGARQYAFAHLRPVKIKKDALGPNTPQKDIWLSPQHRVHHKSHQSAMQYGRNEVLIPAKGMINDTTIMTDNSLKTITYIHILFERHELVFADGLACESFHPGTLGIDAIDDAARTELFDIFPDLRCNPGGYGSHARHPLSVTEAQHLYSSLYV